MGQRAQEHLCWPCRTLQHCLVLLVFVSGCLGDDLQAPRFITQPSASGNIVSEGLTKILQCQALGYPQPEYRWLKDGKFLSDFTSEHFYKIQATKRDDAGFYQCIARNEVGAIFSEKIQVTVAHMAPYVDQSDKTIRVKSGQAVVLSPPSIESSPPPSITWQANDTSFLYGIKYAVTANHKLVILSVAESDQRAYRVRATNTQLGQEENSGYITILVQPEDRVEDTPPELVVSPDNVMVIKGEGVTELHCIANSKELHQVETLWLKDGVPIEGALVPYSFNDLWNRTLSLLSVDVNHSGRYSCQVRLKNRGFPPLSASANVTVLEKPQINGSAGVETLGEFGKIVTLPCKTRGIPSPNILWYRDAVMIQEASESRYQVLPDGSLRIAQLEMEDSGMFQCLASNQAGEVSHAIWLKVKTSAPVMITPPQNVTVLDGKDATVTCVAGGAPSPNITWLFDGEPIGMSGRVQILDQGNLLVAAVRSSDAGMYTCIRSNEAGSIRASAILSVLVRTRVVQPPVDSRVILGHVATMQCKVSSDPAVPYEVTWFHEGRMISPANRIRVHPDGTLEMQEVRASDVGEYECRVTSSGGNETRAARLNVIELPYAPTNIRSVRIMTASRKEVNVSWIPGFDGNSPILKYIIQKRIVPSSAADPLPDPMLNWVTVLSNVSVDQRSVILTNLKASATYQFRVSAVNSVGEGSSSEPSNTVTLPQEPPSGPPIGLVGSARSTSQIIIQWQPPLEEYRNGNILGYLVRYKLYGYSDGPWSYRNITNEAQRNYLIQELITWKDYEIQIAAYNDKGIGLYSEGIKVMTKEGVPEAAPTDVRVRPVNSTSVQVWWKPPDPQKINGINQGYKLQAWKNGEAVKSMTVLPSPFDPLAEQSSAIPDLDKYTEYNVTVLCFTNPGDGRKSEPISVKTNEDVPGEVGSLQFEDITDRAVTVVWSPPGHSNGILLGYSLRHMVKEEPDTIRVKNVSSTTYNSRVTNLKPSTHYQFEIVAWTSVGPGDSRVAVIQSGVEPVLPDAPTRLAVSNIEAFSVMLQFTQSFNGNSSITKWTVQAQTARNSSWMTIYEISDPDATTIAVRNLVPFMQYRLRIIANNVVGSSSPSEPTKLFQTIQAPPSHPPRNVTVRAFSATELRVRWIPLQQMEWYGNPRGYNISYRQIGGDTSLNSVSTDDHNANSFVLTGLEEYALYEVIMQAYNDVGSSGPSPVAVERTREAVPSSGPVMVQANATSSTTIVVHWGEIPKKHQNGLIEGYKVYYGAKTVPFQYKQIDSNSTFTTTLTELRKYIQYHVQVLAYTRVGDGVLSTPPVLMRTFEDVPGAPSNVSFPDVSLTMARIIWDIPEEPNGEILAFLVTYSNDKSKGENFSMEFTPSSRTYRASGLEPEQFYLFTVTARTRLGWGMTAKAQVYTTNNRESPEPPSAPQISQSQVQSGQITFSWAPGRDGFAPLRYYTVQLSEESGPWQTVPERVNPLVTSYVVQNLKPFTRYKFRIQATNDIGPSRWSPESEVAHTLPAAPSRSVTEVKVVPITTTSVRVTWDPLTSEAWNGDIVNGGYRIEYHQITDFPSAFHNAATAEVHGSQSQQAVLHDLIKDKNYEIVVVAYNMQGDGPPSRPVPVYVGEAVPTGEPRDVLAEAVSSAEVKLVWKPPLQSQQNGDLLGYKIFYLAEDHSQDKEEIEVVPALYNAHSLIFLDMFTEYRIQILAFNPAGDGPRSLPIKVKTLQGIPAAPGPLQFSEITMSSLRVSWNPPEKRNGEILGYLVTYETAHQNKDYSKQVTQRVTATHLVVQNLEEEVTYAFAVRAQTVEFGPPSSANVTTGPQHGSPGKPKNLIVSKTVSAVDLNWENGPMGPAPILGFYIESKRNDDTKWQTVARTVGGDISDYTVSYQTLFPSTSYTFRVIAYNKFGISHPAYSNTAVLTPSKLYLEYGYLQQKPFYRQTWFLVAIAALSVIIIILIIAVLCVKSKSYKYKKEAQRSYVDTASVDENTTFPSVEMRQSRRGGGTSSRFSTGGRKSANGTLSMAGKTPPRPSPASVTYSDDDSVKGYDENPDDSSLTEKPSEISSTDSQATESDNESEHSDPPSFVNHYANVNDTLRQSWKKQRPVKNYSSYTDSEPESSAVVSLNGGQIIMNNMARSRAPLPGFSSFV